MLAEPTATQKCGGTHDTSVTMPSKELLGPDQLDRFHVWAHDPPWPSSPITVQVCTDTHATLSKSWSPLLGD